MNLLLHCEHISLATHKYLQTLRRDRCDGLAVVRFILKGVALSNLKCYQFAPHRYATGSSADASQSTQPSRSWIPAMVAMLPS